jgi:hypothetical protein
MNLHEINPKRPHDHVPLLTPDTLVALLEDHADDNEDVYGHLHDMWYEGPACLALWQHDATENFYIIAITEYDRRERARDWALRRADAVAYAAQMRDPEKRTWGWGWYVSNGYVIERRPNGLEIDELR